MYINESVEASKRTTKKAKTVQVSDEIANIHGGVKSGCFHGCALSFLLLNSNLAEIIALVNLHATITPERAISIFTER